MNSKTITTMIIALVAMIGLTGLGSAVTEDPAGNFYAEGDTSGYYAAYSGVGGGIVKINTYTDDGRDHKTVAYNDEMSGWQSVSSGSTNVVRYDEINGGGAMTTYSRDNDGAVISTHISSTQNTKLFQDVTLTATEAGCVNSYTMGAANAEYSMGVATSTDGNAKAMSVTLTGNGHAEMGAFAGASVGNTGIEFDVGDIERPLGGPSYGGTNGDGGLTVRTRTDEDLGLGVTGPATYTFTSRPGSMVYTAPFDGDFEATGYVYAIGTPIS